MITGDSEITALSIAKQVSGEEELISPLPPFLPTSLLPSPISSPSPSSFQSYYFPLYHLSCFDTSLLLTYSFSLSLNLTLNLLFSLPPSLSLPLSISAPTLLYPSTLIPNSHLSHNISLHTQAGIYEDGVSKRVLSGREIEEIVQG